LVVQPAFEIHSPNLKHQVHDLQEFIFQLVVMNIFHHFGLNDVALFIR